MGVAVLTIVASVLSGTLLALVPQKNAGWMGPMRTFGFAAALSVALLHMVPESIEAIGGWAVPALGLGLILPALLGAAGSALWKAGHASAEPLHVELEAGYAGLLVHKVGDGLALGVYAGDLHRTGAAHGFAAALAAHIVPVVAIVVLTFDSVRGRGSALLRALGLALAGLLGVFLTRSVTPGDMATAHGWLSAIAAGMLLHVVAHDLTVDLPTSPLGRTVDFVVATLGLLVSVWGGEAHGAHEHGQPAVDLLHVLGHWALPVTVLLVAGSLLAALVTSRTRTNGPASGARRVAVFLSSTFVVEAAVLSLGLLGWELGLVYVACALVLAVASGLFARGAPSERTSARAEAAHAEAMHSEDGAPQARLGRAVAAVDARLLGAGGSTLLAVLLAALVQTSLDGAFGPELQLRDLPWGLLVAAAGYFCPPAALPVAAALLAEGLAPGVALAGVLLGPALGWLSGRWPPAARPRASTSRWLVALGVPALAGLLASWLGGPVAGNVVHADPGTGSALLGAVAALLVLRIVLRVGFRGFLAQSPLGSGLHTGHAHAHGGASGSLGAHE